ncbi:oxidoreductase [bacterium]|nr:oxidoreductase [bacterium]
MSKLFQPLSLRGVTIKNRIGVSPMCMYSAEEGMPNEWHLVHLGGFAKGGAGLVITEATAVEPVGRISPRDTGLWNDRQKEAWKPITAFIASQGAVPAVQLAHAGRKAGTAPPWESGIPTREWTPVGPSNTPFSADYPTPHPLKKDELELLKTQWIEAAKRAVEAGFQVIEIHAAHGYLLHSFLSPISNLRKDEYGGSRDNRMRFPLEVIRAVRETIPTEMPLLLRISSLDWVLKGWMLEDSVELAREVKPLGVDLVDCSSGGIVRDAQPSAVTPGYQVPYARRIRMEADIPTAAVGQITDPLHAEHILSEERADLVLLGREMLRNPHWTLKASWELGETVDWARQYDRAKLL